MQKKLVLFMVILNLQNFAGINYYVSTSGSNTNNGLSTTSAFKTITYAATIASHGDTINVLPGLYTNATYGLWNVWKTEQTVRINNKNSTSGNYLVIRPYNNGAVKLKGDGNFIFQIRNSSYIRVQGFEIEGELNNIPMDSAQKYQFVYRQCLNTNCTSYKDTFRVALGTPPNVVASMTFQTLNNIQRPTVFNSEAMIVQGSHHIDILQNNIFNSPSAGLRIAESDYTNIIGNQINNCNKRTSVGTPALVLSLINSVDNNNGVKILISRNRVSNNFNMLYSWNPTKTFINPIIDEGKGISLEHCITRVSPNPSWNYGRVRIENNICDHNGFSGINTNEAERVDIINNTCFQNVMSNRGNNTGISLNDALDANVTNNISVSTNTFGGEALSMNTNCTNVSFQNNLVMGTVDSDVDLIDVNTIISNPDFNDTLQFNLKNTSQAINSSLNSVAPLTDYYNIIRDANPDRGAVEYFTTVNLFSNSKNDVIYLYPNPCNDRIYIDALLEIEAIRLYDINGKNVTSKTHIFQSNTNTIIEIDNLDEGTFVLNVNNRAFKFIKN